MPGKHPKMRLNPETARIRFKLIQLGWITPSEYISGLLSSVAKKCGNDNIKQAIELIKNDGYYVKELNDITAKITILYLSNVCSNKSKFNVVSKNNREYLDNILKDILSNE